jgi:hypothetical protein
MPLTVEPPKKTQGRGSAPGTSRRRSRSRRPQSSNEISSKDRSQSFIGQELVELQLPRTNPSEVTTKQSSSKSTTNASVPATSAYKDSKQASHHTLCLDTRFIDTGAGRDAGNEIVQGFQSLVKNLDARGDYCNIIATTNTPNEKKQGKATINFATLRNSQVSKLNIPIQRVALHGISLPLENDVSTPDELSAETSWNLFARMSKSQHFVICPFPFFQQDFNISFLLVGKMLFDLDQRPKENQSLPLEFTILTSDMALFSETCSTKHVDCFERFAQKMKTLSQTDRISIIRLIVVETHMLAIGIDQSPTAESGRDAYKKARTECISAIKGVMDEIEINGSPTSSTGQLVQYSLSLMDGSISSYKALSCKIFRENLGVHNLRRQIGFDLPETPDGTQCRMYFDIFFQIFPYKLGSQEAKTLVEDLHRLSHSTLEIIQLVPVSCVDASLLYGVPFSVNPVLEQNFDRNEETECLTTVFFRYLQERDLSILFRASPSTGQPAGIDRPNDVQNFLLMPQEFPEAMNTPPRSGLLFHYAEANQLISEAVQMNLNRNLDTDMGIQYTEYIESAMSTLDCKPFNPLISEIEKVSNENDASIGLDTGVHSKMLASFHNLVAFHSTGSQIQTSFAETDQMDEKHYPTAALSVKERDKSQKINKRMQATRPPFNSPPFTCLVADHPMENENSPPTSEVADQPMKSDNSPPSTNQVADHPMESDSEQNCFWNENHEENSDIEYVEPTFEYDV